MVYKAQHKLGSNLIKRVEFYKYLGTLCDFRMKLHEHINKQILKKKISI